jgi:hypothetical protein
MAGRLSTHEMAAHESPRTTKLYDRRTKERLTQDEVERSCEQSDYCKGRRSLAA